MTMTENNNNIIRPNHYTSEKGFEVFDVQEAFIHELKGMSASYWCNIVKYILRFQRKNGVEDLKKAKYYSEIPQTCTHNTSKILFRKID